MRLRCTTRRAVRYSLLMLAVVTLRAAARTDADAIIPAQIGRLLADA